jgi:hypothetical protein
MIARLPAPRTRDDGGLVAVVVALVFALVLVPLLALVVDLGVSRVAVAKARDVADAAALAAALERPDAGGAERATAVARSLVDDGLGVSADEWAACVDQHPLPAGTAPSAGNCVSFDLTARQVRVTLPARRVPGVFAGLLGATPPAVSATSVATWGPLPQPCALCVLGAYSGGAQQLVVRGGDAAVGGDLTLGATASLLLDPGRTLTVGGDVLGAGAVGLPAVPGPVPTDPLAPSLAALAALPAASPAARAQPSPSGACAPGTYVDVSGCTSFAAGVYVVTGQPAPAGRSTVTLQGGGSGVVLYLTCSGNDPGTGEVHAAACATVSRRPPRLAVAAGAGGIRLEGHPGYGGLALAVDPGVPAGQSFTGTGTLTVAGSVGAPATVLRNPVPGTSSQLVVTGGRLVVRRVAYDLTPAVPPHPYVVVEAPIPAADAGGAVRLLAPPAP